MRQWVNERFAPGFGPSTFAEFASVFGRLFPSPEFASLQSSELFLIRSVTAPATFVSAVD